jgi:threonine/homoserine/homoserine lactone efflux protein
VQLLILGGAFAAVCFAFEVAVAFAAGALGKRLLRNARAVRVLDGVAGVVMIALGIALFSEPRRT